jgi:glycosyltransferase involved in cell wall biosynthesis
MISVGFNLQSYGSQWMGGINYITNLIAATRAAGNGSYRCTAFVASDAESFVLAKLEDVGAHIVQQHIPARVASAISNLSRRASGTDVLTVGQARFQHIDVMSHSNVGLSFGAFATVDWIPDFQHIYLPELFTPSEREQRTKNMMSMGKTSDIVVVSSEAAQTDAIKFFGAKVPRLRILRFCPLPCLSASGPKSVEHVQRKYGLYQPFIYMPNQFWAHKNHELVIRAIAAMSHKYPDVLVVCTGNPSDYRDRGHYRRLMQLIDDLGVSKHLRMLGVVPYESVNHLMLSSSIVLNPSRFEGWSTVIEEAKGLGKRCCISDIPVHREQAPERAFYFSPTSVDSCVSALTEALEDSRSSDPESLLRNAVATRAQEFVRFGHEYISILNEARGAKRPEQSY